MENQSVQNPQPVTPEPIIVSTPTSTRPNLSPTQSNWLVIVLSLLTVSLLAITLLLFYQNQQLKKPAQSNIPAVPELVSSYEECVKTPGARIQESYPAVCVVPSGEKFTQDVTVSGAPVVFSTCQSINLNVLLTLPNSYWTCKVDDLGKEQKGLDGTMALSSPLFKVQISSLGRGGPCDLSDPDPQSPRHDPTNACTISEFYAQNGILLKTYKLNGKAQEIFGQIGSGPSISITYTDMNKRDLTSGEKAEIISLLDSIKTLQ